MSESGSDNEQDEYRVSPGTTTADAIKSMSGHWIALTNSANIQEDPLLSKFPLISYRKDTKAFAENVEAHHASTSVPSSYSQLEPMASTISLGVVSLSHSVWGSETTDTSDMDVDSSDAIQPTPILTSTATRHPRPSQIIDWSPVDITLIFFAHTMTTTILLYLRAYVTFFKLGKQRHEDTYHEDAYRQKVLRFITRLKTLGLLLIFVWVGLWAPPTSVTAFIHNYEGHEQAHLTAKIIRYIVKIGFNRKRGIIHCTLLLLHPSMIYKQLIYSYTLGL